ncbi:MAG: hypothetical protein R3F38_04395 [Gammaproteobacteria bacterium]
MTKVGITVNGDDVTNVAINSIKAVSDKPHGIFGVDMAYDKDGVPNPTEINISRFFTTVRFFTEAGLNLPEIFKCYALGEDVSLPETTVNPLETNLMWVRGMDTSPRLVVRESLEREIIFL